MKKVIVFGRVSSAHQDFTAQVAKVKQAVIADGFNEDEIIIVEGKESAIKLAEEERQTLNEMKDVVEHNPTIEAVYIFALDRLARRVSVILSVKDWLVERGINLVFLYPQKMATLRMDNGKKVEDPITKLVLMMLGYGAEMEMKIKQERANTVRAMMMKENKVLGKLLFGYKADANKNAVIDVEKASIVKWVFTSYTTREMSSTEIFNEGVKRGYWSNLPSKAARASKVLQMLKNHAYCGEPLPNGFKYPAIVDKSAVDKAIEIAKESCNKAKHAYKYVFLGKGIATNVADGLKLGTDSSHLMYRSVHSAMDFAISTNVLDSLIWSVASDSKYWLIAAHDEDTIKANTAEIERITKAVSNLRKVLTKEIAPKRQRVYNLYINGKMDYQDMDAETKRIDKESSKYEREIESLQKKQAELQAVLNEISSKGAESISPNGIYKIEDYQHQRQIVEETIESVSVEKLSHGHVIRIKDKFNGVSTYLNLSVNRKIKLVQVFLEERMDDIINGNYEMTVDDCLLNGEDVLGMNVTAQYKMRYKRLGR